jgi:hypothetical protein
VINLLIFRYAIHYLPHYVRSNFIERLWLQPWADIVSLLPGHVPGLQPSSPQAKVDVKERSSDANNVVPGLQSRALQARVAVPREPYASSRIADSLKPIVSSPCIGLAQSPVSNRPTSSERTARADSLLLVAFKSLVKRRCMRAPAPSSFGDIGVTLRFQQVFCT